MINELRKRTGSLVLFSVKRKLLAMLEDINFSEELHHQ